MHHSLPSLPLQNLTAYVPGYTTWVTAITLSTYPLETSAWNSHLALTGSPTSFLVERMK